MQLPPWPHSSRATLPACRGLCPRGRRGSRSPGGGRDQGAEEGVMARLVIVAQAFFRPVGSPDTNPASPRRRRGPQNPFGSCQDTFFVKTPYVSFLDSLSWVPLDPPPGGGIPPTLGGCRVSGGCPLTEEKRSERWSNEHPASFLIIPELTPKVKTEKQRQFRSQPTASRSVTAPCPLFMYSS